MKEPLFLGGQNVAAVRPAHRSIAVVPVVLALALAVTVAPSAHAADIGLEPCTTTTVAEAQARILSDTNAARIDEGLEPYTSDAHMTAVAQNWSLQQVADGEMHPNPLYAEQIPAGWITTAQNVAKGFRYTQVTQGWLNSPPHRANILNPDSTHMGIGAACDGRSIYYTQIIAQYPADHEPPTDPVIHTADRYAGIDRYATSAAISAATFAPGIDVVYLASGATFPDALSASAAAGAGGGAVLLSQPDGIPAVVQDELTRLSPGKIVLLGGSAVLSDAVHRQAQHFTAAPIERVPGVDRYDTSAQISGSVFDTGVDAVFLASGADFPDALAGGAAASAFGAPLLLVQPDALPEYTRAELERLAPAIVYVLGGSAVVSEAVLDEAASYARDGAARIAGDDRYETAARTAALAFPMGANVAMLADGSNFPDALSGSAAAAALGGAVILTRQDALPEVVDSYLSELHPGIVIALGGVATVSTRALAQAAQHVPR